MGELKRVLVAGGQARRCVFSGVAKTTAEIKFALEVGVRCFNVESAPELKRIESVAQSMGKIAPISMRVNPNVDAKTHPYISTGLKENKFGVAICEVLTLYQYAQNSQYLDVQGLDCHIGSQITQISPFLDTIDIVLELLEKLKSSGIFIQHLDLGGGIGIDYEGEQTIDIQAYIDVIIDKVGDLEIILEPGRAIVGNAGALITQVEFLKQTADKSFAIVDSAMNDLIRPTLYGAYHQVLPVSLNKQGIEANWDLVGPVCETGDFLAKDRKLSLSEGDYLAIMSAGAYAFSMSSNYNSRPKVAEVMVQKTQHHLIRARETFEDLFALERLMP
jgi:diaminopimelate decarboxylase